MVSNIKVHDCDAITIHLLKRLCGDQPCSKLSSVRRNLFGFCEKKRKNTKAQAYGPSLDEEFRDKAKKATREWNFDFENGVPLPGKYVWQRVRSCEVPPWYAAMERPAFKDALTKEEKRRNKLMIDQNTCLSKSETEVGLKEIPEEKRQQQPSSKKPRLVQTSMKDFTRVQKRRSSRRLQLKQLQLYSTRSRLLRNHHHLPLHLRSVPTIC